MMYSTQILKARAIVSCGGVGVGGGCCGKVGPLAACCWRGQGDAEASADLHVVTACPQFLMTEQTFGIKNCKASSTNTLK